MNRLQKGKKRVGYLAPTPIDDGLDGDNDVIKVGTEKKLHWPPVFATIAF